MKKIVAIILAGLLISPVLAGCAMPEESPGELMGASTVTEATTVVTETAPTAEPTEAPTEPAPRFEAGQQVFCVYQHEGGMTLRRFFFVSLEGEIVIVTTAIPGSGEAGELLSFPIDNCYADSDDAWAAAGQEPME